MSDIFVSYAHINNKPHSGQEHGWITHFIDNLGNELGQRLGRAKHYELWMDYRLQGNDQVTPEIEQQLRATNILVIMMSKGWLESPWCVKELEYFCEVHDDISGRLFIIDQDGLPREAKPENTRDFLTYPFYEKTLQGRIRQLGHPVPQPSHQTYFDQVVDLSYHLAKAVQQFATRPDADLVPPVIKNPKATVYVAPVNDSLFGQRATLVSELQQFDIQVLPAVNRHDSDMDNTLAQCSHFIQLLDDSFAMGMPCDQLLTAETAEIPVMQWHDPELDYREAYHEQKNLLQGETVQVCELSDFSRQVRKTVLPTPQEKIKPVTNGNQMVFIHAMQDDMDRAAQLKQRLRVKGFTTLLPRYEGEPKHIRRIFERGYQECDILLMLHEKVPAYVIDDHLFDIRAAMLKREKKLQILICTPVDSDEFSLEIAEMKTLACSHNFDEHCMEQFLSEVDA